MSVISVVLLQKVTKHAKPGDIIKLKRGYVRNYLIPRGKVVYATKENIIKYEALKGELLENERKEELKAKKFFTVLNKSDVDIIATAGSDGKLFGSINPKDIITAIKSKYAIDLEKKDIVLDSLIKVVGIFEVGIKLHHHYTATVFCNVAPSLAEIEGLKKKLKKDKEDELQQYEKDKLEKKAEKEKVNIEEEVKTEDKLEKK